ncbi:MAG TPA: DUF4256 domain-containing protein [Aggregatilineales bacterium]|nr:DUF4256 domain-containing protein [Aggregatilineales bacterium]
MELLPDQREALLATLKARFEKHTERHPGLDWARVQDRLDAHPDKLWSLHEMERTGGEPDVVAFDDRTGAFIFMDCAKQSPKGRRSLCYDGEARESRKEYPPENSALEMAEAMGIEVLTEAQYRSLQKVGEFDTTTSSWIITPPDIRERGGALFGDWRYGHVFIYHNGVQSYYAARGFRGALKV